MGIIKNMYESMCYEKEKEKLETTNCKESNSNICILSGKACYFGICDECSLPESAKVKM